MQERFYSIDYLRVILAAFVVFGHAHFGYATFGEAWIVGANSVFRAAVPVFAVISGFFLLHSFQRGHFLAWCKRIFALYVIWSLIYYAFVGAIGDASWISIRSFVLGFWHLWFLQGLLISAVMLALLRRFGARVLIASAAVCAVTGVVLQYAHLTGHLDIPMEIYRSGPCLLFPYVCMGYLIAEGYDSSARSGRTSYGLSTPQLVFLAGLGLCLALAENAVELAVLGNGRILEIPSGLFLMCPAIFALTLRVNMPATAWPLARISSAIYILHVFFVFGLQELLGLPVPLTVLLSLVVPTLLVLLQDRTARGRRWMSWAF